MNRLLGLICAVVTAMAVLAWPSAAAETTEGVPPGFMPSSTSWTDRDNGWVLGFAPCPAGQCPSLLRTSNGGASWSPWPTPPVTLSSVDDRPRVYFANAGDGIVTDGQNVLYATHDGGLRWEQLKLPGTIGGLASTDRALLAIVTSEAGTQLFASPLHEDLWAPVDGVALPEAGTGEVVAIGSNAYVVLNAVHQSNGYWTTNGGAWHAAQPPCPADASADLGLAGDQTVYALCSYNPGAGSMFKDLLRSTSAGPFEFVSSAPNGGITTSFAAASTASMTIAVHAGGTAWLYRGEKQGTNWETTVVVDEPRFRDLAFTDARYGTVVWGGPLEGEAAVYRTADSGATWTPLTFQD